MVEDIGCEEGCIILFTSSSLSFGGDSHFINRCKRSRLPIPTSNVSRTFFVRHATTRANAPASSRKLLNPITIVPFESSISGKMSADSTVTGTKRKALSNNGGMALFPKKRMNERRIINVSKPIHRSVSQSVHDVILFLLRSFPLALFLVSSLFPYLSCFVAYVQVQTVPGSGR